MTNSPASLLTKEPRKSRTMADSLIINRTPGKIRASGTELFRLLKQRKARKAGMCFGHREWPLQLDPSVWYS